MLEAFLAPYLPKKHGTRYWSRGAAVVAFLSGLYILATMLFFSFAIASHMPKIVMLGFATFIVTAGAWTIVLLRTRRWYDFFFETDFASWIRRWDPWSDVTIELRSAHIAVSGDKIDISEGEKSMTFTRNCLGYERLRSLILEFRAPGA